MHVQRSAGKRSNLPAGRTLRPLPLTPLEPAPLISVLLSSYNYERYIGAALESLRAQSYGNFEVIVCDDGSSDGSVELIARFCAGDRRFRLLTQENSGQAVALNTAFEAAGGEIIALMDSDDCFRSTKLEHVAAALVDGSNGAVLHALDVTDSGGAITGRIPLLGRVESGWLAERILRRGGRWRFLPTSAIAFRREVAESIFPIPAQLRISPDAFVFTLLPLLTVMSYVAEPLGEYRVHGSNAFIQSVGSAEEKVRRNADFWLEVITFVNQRLDALEFPSDMRLDAARNPEYRHRTFVAEMLGGRVSRPVLARGFTGLAGTIIRDDLYKPVQKLALLALFGFAIPLPASWRAKFLETGWSVLPALRRALDRVKAPWRR